MAVEAGRPTLFPSHRIPNRNLMGQNQANGIQGGGFLPYGNNQMVPGGMPAPPNAAAFRVVQGQLIRSAVPAAGARTPTMNHPADPGLAIYNNNQVAAAAARKRSRDSFMNHQYVNVTAAAPAPLPQTINNVVSSNVNSVPQFDGSAAGYGQDIDQIIAEHTKKITLELEERHKRETEMLVSAMSNDFQRKLHEKDVQLQRMEKFAMAMQENMKSFSFENQIWKDLAQSNEAAANTLRASLEQVLAYVNEGFPYAAGPAPDLAPAPAGGGGGEQAQAEDDDDAGSCCGSSGAASGERRTRRRLAEEDGGDNNNNNNNNDRRLCKKCGEGEPSVLVMPCRDLCYCSPCGSSLNLIRTCPVCNGDMHATMHINLC